ncbi:hypothetical protein AB0D56_18745 [Streptomyces sp. NPDC048209]|uniref:hypothetical protein n=1 Tax=Streptomyces sp. NPDC048209 TaxID=3156689 RepID=UPI003445F043
MVTLAVESAPDGSTVTATLGGQRTVLARLGRASAVGGAASLTVDELLRARSFADEQSGFHETVVARYGSALWDWLTESFDDGALEAFLTSRNPVIEVIGHEDLQSHHWELVNSAGSEEDPEWLGLKVAVHRVTVRRAGPPDTGEAPRHSGAVLFTARPFIDDDIPVDVPVAAIAEACHRIGHRPPAWVPSTSRAVLEHRARRSGTPAALLHLDMHGARLEQGSTETIGGFPVPHVVLESEFGADPCTVSSFLDQVGGVPPRVLLLTSCEADATDVPVADSIPAQAFQRGVEAVIVSRRRLTPDEVVCFSAAFHSVLAGGADLEEALRTGRNRLHEASAAAHGRRIGAYAWASFCLYNVGGGTPPTDLTVPAPSQAVQAEPLLPVPRMLTSPLARGHVAVVQALGASHRDQWTERLRKWGPLLADAPDQQQVDPPESAAQAIDALVTKGIAGSGRPMIRLHDWTSLSDPESVLNDMAAGTSRFAGLAARMADAYAPGTLDVIFVSCNPEWVVGAHLDPELSLVPTREGWPAEPATHRGESDLVRWLNDADHSVTPDVGTVLEPLATSDGLPTGSERFGQLLRQLIEVSGHSEDEVLAGLRSCSAGFLRSAGQAPLSDSTVTTVFEALDAFSTAAWHAGLALRHTAGPLVFDVYHPRLAAAARQRVLGSPHGEDTRWYEWDVRVEACAADLKHSPDIWLPDHQSLADRLRLPQRLFGQALLSVSARNYVFHTLTEYGRADRTRAPARYWDGLWDQGDGVDRAWVEFVADAVEARPPAPRPSKPTKVHVTRINLDGTPPSPADPRTAQALADALVDLSVQTPAALASLILSAGLEPGASHLQSRTVVQNGVAALVMAGERPTPARLSRVVAGYPWPEDRGHVHLDAALHMLRLNLPADALPLLDEALALYLTSPGPHSRGHAVEILTLRGAVRRALGHRRLWEQDVRMAARLVTDSDWHWFVRHIPPLLEQAWRLDDGTLHLRLTGLLWHSAAADERAAPWLVKHRGQALIRHHRHTEAMELLASLEADTLHARTRSVAQLLQVHCLRALGQVEDALATCQELLTYATDTVLAQAHYHRGALLDLLERDDEAVENDRAGAAVTGGDTGSTACALRLCRRLLAAGDHEGCRRQAHHLRGTCRYPASASAAAIEASAMVLAGHPDDEVRSVLRIAAWSPGVRGRAALGAACAEVGKQDLLESVLADSVAEQRAWLLGDESPVASSLGLNVESYVDAITSQNEYGLDSMPSAPQPVDRDIVFAYAEDLTALGDALWDHERLDHALACFRAAVTLLDHDVFNADPHSALALAHAVYAVATLHRRLGKREEALAWGRMARRHGAEGLSSCPPETAEQWREHQRLAWDLMGNCFFDQGAYHTSAFHHGVALRLALRLPHKRYDVLDVLHAALDESAPTWGIVHSLGNFGNSLRELGLTRLYHQSRAVALLVAARLDDLDALARMPDTAYTLRLISNPYGDLPASDPLGAALARVRAALREADPEQH